MEHTFLSAIVYDMSVNMKLLLDIWSKTLCDDGFEVVNRDERSYY